MSGENVELVRRISDCFARGEHDWPFTVYDEDIVWQPIRAPGTEPVYHGHDGVRRFWRDWFQSFANVEFEQLRYLDAGDTVVVVLTIRARGRASGAEVEYGPYTQNWTIRDGRITAMRIYTHVDEGLRAAGLDPADAGE